MHYVTVFVDSSVPTTAADNATTRELHRLGIPFEVIDVFMLDHPDVMREVLNRFGFREFPVVVSSAGAWSGTRTDFIETLHRSGLVDPYARPCDHTSPNKTVILSAENSEDGQPVLFSVVTRDPDDPAAKTSFRDRIMSRYFSLTRGKGPSPEHRAEVNARREALYADMEGDQR